MIPMAAERRRCGAPRDRVTNLGKLYFVHRNREVKGGAARRVGSGTTEVVRTYWIQGTEVGL